MKDQDLKQFMENKQDFGKLPADFEMTDEQKQLSVLAMAVNATIVQFINEGLFPPDQQLHFMGHLHDFTNRLYNDEAIKLPNTFQTLQTNSKSATLFLLAMENAFTEGSANFDKIKQFTQELKQTITDMSDNKPRTLN